MAKSFKDINGIDVQFDHSTNFSFETVEDIVTGEVTAYKLTVDGDFEYEVSEKVYNAVKEFQK